MLMVKMYLAKHNVMALDYPLYSIFFCFQLKSVLRGQWSASTKDVTEKQQMD
jgi:hypothetical protein